MFAMSTPTPPRRDELGASSVEYGLIAVAIAALIVVIAFAFGGVVVDLFGSSCTTIETQAATGNDCGD